MNAAIVAVVVNVATIAAAVALHSSPSTFAVAATPPLPHLFSLLPTATAKGIATTPWQKFNLPAMQ